MKKFLAIATITILAGLGMAQDQITSYSGRRTVQVVSNATLGATGYSVAASMPEVAYVTFRAASTGTVAFIATVSGSQYLLASQSVTNSARIVLPTVWLRPDQADCLMVTNGAPTNATVTVDFRH